MLPSFLLSLREGLEAALIVGIVLSILRKTNRQDLKITIWQGVVAAGVVSLVAALVLNWIGAEFEGIGEMIFEGATMLLAAGILTWMIFWMHRQPGNVKRELETGVRKAATQTGQKALFALAFLAVTREGLELALFLVAARMASDAWQTISGSVLGLATAAMFGFLLFASTHRLNLRRFFQITNILLIIVAAGLVSLGVHEFNEAGIIPAVIDHAWDVNFILNENSPVGAILKALVGYSGSPSLAQVIAYLAYFALVIAGLRKQPAAITPARAAAD